MVCFGVYKTTTNIQICCRSIKTFQRNTEYLCAIRMSFIFCWENTQISPKNAFFIVLRKHTALFLIYIYIEISYVRFKARRTSSRLD